MRTHLIALAFALVTGCGGATITTLPLTWRGIDTAPRPSSEVNQALASASVQVRGFTDSRPDKTAIGVLQDDGFVVRTPDDVAVQVSSRFAIMLRALGARMDELPTSFIDGEILEFQVVEGGIYSGIARLRISVSHSDGTIFSKVYTGTSKRWGRSHSSDNFSETLSNAFESATQEMLRDKEFGRALLAAGPAAPMAPMTPAVQVAPVAPAAPGAPAAPAAPGGETTVIIDLRAIPR